MGVAGWIPWRNTRVHARGCRDGTWSGRWPRRALRGDGFDVASDLFEVEGGVLRTRGEMLPIMITNDPGIAVDDCLFYVVRAQVPIGT